MKSVFYFPLWLLLLLSAYVGHKKPVVPEAGYLSVPPYQVQVDTFTLFDSSRHRSIPLALYTPLGHMSAPDLQVVLFSHGYGENKGGSYLAYTYLSNFLAAQGYVVASIQHELPTDELIPTTGNLRETRRPNWERGVQNMLFVLADLKRRIPHADFGRLSLIGHSNGGDMSMLFATEHPELVYKVISLDNRRMPLPRVQKPRVYSLRSSDLPADEGVLPSPEEQQKFGMTIIQLHDTKHNDMWDQATPAQRQEINGYLLRFLQK